MNINNLSDGLFSNRKKSIYETTSTIKDSRKNLGRDYTQDVLKIGLSGMLLKNVVLVSFIGLIEEYVVDLIKATTHLRVFKSFTVKKDYTKVR